MIIYFLSRRFAKKKLLYAGSEVVLYVKHRLRCLKNENRAISKTKAHFQNKTSPPAVLLDPEDSANPSIKLEGFRFENSVSPRNHLEGINVGQSSQSNVAHLDCEQSIVRSPKSKQPEGKTKSCVKSITVHSSSACDTLPSVE